MLNNVRDNRVSPKVPCVVSKGCLGGLRFRRVVGRDLARIGIRQGVIRIHDALPLGIELGERDIRRRLARGELVRPDGLLRLRQLDDRLIRPFEAIGVLLNADRAEGAQGAGRLVLADDGPSLGAGAGPLVFVGLDAEERRDLAGGEIRSRRERRAFLAHEQDDGLRVILAGDADFGADDASQRLRDQLGSDGNDRPGDGADVIELCGHCSFPFEIVRFGLGPSRPVSDN